MNRNVTLAVVLTILAIVLAFDFSSNRQQRGLLPPDSGIDPMTGMPSPEERIRLHIRNLSFEKEGRTFAAARNLGNLGAEARSAIPRLEELIAAEPDADGFPSPRQKEAYRDALAKIQAGAEKESAGPPVAKP